MSAILDQYKKLMVSFEKGQPIAVDVGLSGVKIALLSKSKKGNYKLEKYHATPLSEASIIEDEIQKPEEILDAIATTVKRLSIKKKITCLGMSGPNTVTKRLQVPDGSKDEVEDNIMWESEQYIPFGADDAEIGFSIIGKIENEDIVDSIVGAARGDIIESYAKVIEEAGLIAKIVDLNVFALTNAFEYIYSAKLPELSEQGFVILDFGAQYTTIIVYKNGGPVLTREINIGGVLITEEIQRRMGVSYIEAEDLKIRGDDNGNLPEEIVGIIEQHIDKLVEGLKKVLNFYIAAGSSEQVSSCFITGGSSKLPGLEEALEKLMDVEIESINPFEAIDIKAKAGEEELDEIATCGLVAIGLGMRSVK